MADTGFGTTLTIDASAVAEIISFSGPNITVNAVDATHMESTEEWKEFIAGLKDAGELTLGINYEGGQYAALLALIDGEAHTAVVTFPDTSTVEVEVLVTGLSAEVPIDDRMTCEITLKITGAPDFTSGA